MNAETSSVLATLFINGVIGIVVQILFEWWRISQLDVYCPKLRKDDGEMLPDPGRYPFSWVKAVCSVTDDEMITIAGMDAFVNLRFMKICFYIITICMIFSIGGLCPIYATSDESSDITQGITLFSMANIPDGSDKLWAPFACAYLFTIVFIIFMYKEYENFTRVRILYFKTGDVTLPRQMSYSVQVENIPMEYRTSPRLKELFTSWFGTDVLYAYVATCLTPLDTAVTKRKALLTQLEGFIAQFEADELKTRPTLKLHNYCCCSCCCCCVDGIEVDAIYYLYDQITILNEEIVILQLQAKMIADGTNRDSTTSAVAAATANDTKEKIELEIEWLRPTLKNSAFGDATLKRFSIESQDNDDKVSKFIATFDKKISSKHISGTGFVTFKSRCSQATATQLTTLSDDFPRLKVIPAPEPRDIVWNNMSTSTEYTEIVQVFTSLMYYVGLLFWSVILAFIASISNLSNLEKYLPFIKQLDAASLAFLQGMLPVIVMIVFLMLVPIFMACVAQYLERHKTFSKIDQEVFKW